MKASQVLKAILEESSCCEDKHLKCLAPDTSWNWYENEQEQKACPLHLVVDHLEPLVRKRYRLCLARSETVVCG